MNTEGSRAAGHLIATLISLSVVGCAIQGRADLVHEPRFTLCARAGPPGRSDYPADFDVPWSVERDRCGLVSGYDFMWQYVAIGAKRPVAVQLVRFQRRRIDPCGAPMVSGGDEILEVFRQPANDTIMSAFCCESWQSDLVEGWVTIYEEDVAARDVRAALAAIQSGQNVVGLNTRISPARFGQLARDVEAKAQIRWRASYDYDGCDPNDPATRCNRAHCMSMSWTDSITSSTRSYTSP